MKSLQQAIDEARPVCKRCRKCEEIWINCRCEGFEPRMTDREEDGIPKAPAVDVEKALYKALIAADECIRLVPCATVQDAVTAMRKVRAAIALYESKEKL